MFGFFRHNTKDLDNAFLEFEHFYKNNYKDEAHKSFAEVLRLFDEKKASGRLSKRELARYTKLINDYKEKLKDYTHYKRIGW